MSDLEGAILLSRELHDAAALLRRVQTFVTGKGCSALHQRTGQTLNALRILAREFDACIENALFEGDQQ